jgi:chromosome segregation ATPase
MMERTASAQVSRNAELASAGTKLTAALASAAESRASFETQNRSLKDQIATLKAGATEAGAKNDELQREKDDLAANGEAHASMTDTIENLLEALEKTKEEVSRRFPSVLSPDDLRSQIDLMNTSLKEKDNELTKVRLELSNAKKTVEGPERDLRSQIDQLNTSLKAKDNELTKVRLELSNAKKTVEGSERKRRRSRSSDVGPSASSSTRKRSRSGEKDRRTNLSYSSSRQSSSSAHHSPSAGTRRR